MTPETIFERIQRIQNKTIRTVLQVSDQLIQQLTTRTNSRSNIQHRKHRQTKNLVKRRDSSHEPNFAPTFIFSTKRSADSKEKLNVSQSSKWNQLN